jgi:hypothetical protein
VLNDRILANVFGTCCGKHTEKCSCRTCPFLLFVLSSLNKTLPPLQQVHGLGTRLTCKSAVVSATASATCWHFLYSIRLAVQRRRRIYPSRKYNFHIHVMRTALFWAITQRVVITPYRRFGTNCRVPSSGFRRGVDESCALLGYYAASSDNSLPAFRDNLSIPSSRVKKSLLRSV